MLRIDGRANPPLVLIGEVRIGDLGQGGRTGLSLRAPRLTVADFTYRRPIQGTVMSAAFRRSRW
jgi:hypothetical protein